MRLCQLCLVSGRKVQAGSIDCGSAGGFHAAAKRMNLKSRRQQRGHWADVQVAAGAIQLFLQESGSVPAGRQHSAHVSRAELFAELGLMALACSCSSQWYCALATEPAMRHSGNIVSGMQDICPRVLSCTMLAGTTWCMPCRCQARSANA